MAELPQDDALTDQVRTWLDALGAGRLAPAVRVRWNPRMRSNAGTAEPGTGWIELNPRLRGTGDGQVDRILRHEAAHMLAQWRAGNRRIPGHGREWQQACADLGIPGEQVTHRLPFPRRTLVRKYCYQCPSCGLQVQRVRRFKRATACLACCRTYNAGRFHRRFQFRQVPFPPTPGTALM